MCKIAYVCIFVVYLIIETKGFGYGSHCRKYPYAPRCLGVAAKRSPQQYEEKNRQSTLDIYSTLIKRVLDAAKRGTESKEEEIIMQDKSNLYDDNTLFDRLATMLENIDRGTYKRDRYIDTPNTWSDHFDEEDRGI